ncbi:hypothetical protein [Methylocaldum sp. RMAD-M]|nr:hypothetical protein [Methylocaldum sp. RMAD-M]MBP1149850.1 hypothetical protein [Methylocaldum sp. RMAD-M]
MSDPIYLSLKQGMQMKKFFHCAKIESNTKFGEENAAGAKAHTTVN